MARDIYEDHDEVGGDAKDPVATILVVLSTLTLLLALYMIQKALGDHFNEGMMKKDKATATSSLNPGAFDFGVAKPLQG